MKRGELGDAFAEAAELANALEIAGAPADSRKRAGRRMTACEELCEFEQLEPRILLSASEPIPEAGQPDDFGSDFGGKILVEMDGPIREFDADDRFKYAAEEEEMAASEDLIKRGAEEGEQEAGEAVLDRPRRDPREAMKAALARVREQQSGRAVSDNLAEDEVEFLIDDPAPRERVFAKRATEELVATLRAGRAPPEQFILDYEVPDGFSSESVTLRLADGGEGGVFLLEDEGGTVLVQADAAAVSAVKITGRDGVSDSLVIDYSGGEITVPVHFDGGAGGGDTLYGPAIDLSWSVTGVDRGEVAGITFGDVENLTGAADTEDTFIMKVGGYLSGLMHGGDRGFDILELEGGEYASVKYVASGPASPAFCGGC